MPATHKRCRTKTMVMMHPDGRDEAMTVAINTPYPAWFIAVEKLEAGESVLVPAHHAKLIREEYTIKRQQPQPGQGVE